MDELDEFARLGADVPAMSPAIRGQARTQLLARAAQEVAVPGSRPRWRPARRLVAAVAAAVAAATAAVVVPLATGGSPAYAVTKQPDGSVVVKIKEFRDPEKLQASLRKAGVPAVVEFLPPGHRCIGSRGKSVPPLDRTGGQVAVASMNAADDYGDTVIRIYPARIKPGWTLLMQAVFYTRPVPAKAVGTYIVDGPVSPCHLAPAPA